MNWLKMSVTNMTLEPLIWKGRGRGILTKVYKTDKKWESEDEESTNLVIG